MKRYCFALDLQPDPESIRAYEKHHEAVWPEILQTFEQAGISAMEIYRIEERLFMIMDTEDHFSLEEKAFHDAQNPFVQKWESLMWEYQVALPTAKPNEKWVLMRPIIHWKA